MASVLSRRTCIPRSMRYRSKATAPEKLTKAAAVVSRTMRAIRPASAPKRSASIGTLLALGSAAASASTVREKASRAGNNCQLADDERQCRMQQQLAEHRLLHARAGTRARLRPRRRAGDLRAREHGAQREQRDR